MTPAEMLQQGRRMAKLEKEVARLRAQHTDLLEALRAALIANVANTHLEPHRWFMYSSRTAPLPPWVSKAREAIRRAEEGLAHE